MHKVTFLEGTLRFTIRPDGPILVKAGESSGVDPTLPDMRFVRSQGQIYIPGPSLKGVVRAQAERICRSLDSSARQNKGVARRHELDARDQQAIEQREQARRQNGSELTPEDRTRLRLAADGLIPLADNPLGNGTSYSGLDDMSYSSGRAIEAMGLPAGPERSAIVYRRSSFVSQLFGHTSLAGRVRFADATVGEPLTIEERNGVAIDRIYGSVAVGPFNYEVVVEGSFVSRIDFKNVTLAQLALLGLALRDMAEGRVGIGFGKSRGLGRVKVAFDSLELRYPTCALTGDSLTLLGRSAAICNAQELAGLGAFCAGSEFGGYALPTQDTATLPADLAYAEDELLGVNLVATGDQQVRLVWKACMDAWKREVGL